MPSVGYGCWKVANEQLADCTYNAIKSGYRLFDEASDYGNEKECGQGIARAISEGLVKREDLFITSKLWNTFHRKEHVVAACKRSLADLGLDYLDLYLIHFPIALKYVPHDHRYPPGWSHEPTESPAMIEDNVAYHETWAAVEELVAAGLVRNIGCSNIGPTMLRDVCNYAKVQPAVLQVEMHPHNTQEKLLKFCQQKNIAVTAYSSFGGGSYVEMGMCKEAETVLVDPLFTAMGAKHGRTPAQIALRWAVQRGTAIIPKSTKTERMVENISIFDFELSEEEMNSIAALNQGRRFNDPGNYAEPAFKLFFPIFD